MVLWMNLKLFSPFGQLFLLQPPWARLVDLGGVPLGETHALPRVGRRRFHPGLCRAADDFLHAAGQRAPAEAGDVERYPIEESGELMSVNDNKQLVVDFYEALVREDYEAAAAMCHEDFVFYNQIDTPRPGAEGFIEAEKKHLDAFKGFSMQVDTVGEGDRVGAYVIFEGDHCKEFYGVPPAGAHLRMSMFNLFTIADGKVIEKRAHYDRYDHIEQLTAGAKQIG
jgi:steroid delta-isomerase-like uncharacterized protein